MDSENEYAPPWVKHKFQPGEQIKTPTLFTFVSWQSIPENLELTQSKLEVEKYEKAHIWELAKKMVNPYEFIHTQDESHFHSSLCILRPLSRSFFKMIEMLYVFNFFEILPKQIPKLRSAHVAEGPGGFIEAFYERCDREKRLIASVLAMTLKPTTNNVPGWRRANHFLQKHREIKLHYGTDGTGDIYRKENQASFIEQSKPGVHLFTADGGFDFSIDYEEQEKQVYHLLVCSACIGLQVLNQGGCFVLKLFDIGSIHTRILVCLLARCFREWMLYKPATSRPCNSERYFLGKGYRGQNSAILQMLQTLQTQSAQQKYPISTSFFTESENSYLESQYQQQLEIQKKFLKRGLSYIKDSSLWKEDVESNFKKSLEWCSTFQVPVLQRKLNWNSVESVVSQMSERVSALQSLKPDVEKENLHPFDQASQA
jgi:23S rRNA U2552 (ribose-2'-O)-methylase RlmE/FtsJ